MKQQFKFLILLTSTMILLPSFARALPGAVQATGSSITLPSQFSISTVAFQCTCHVFGSSNPYEEAACNALQVGTTCGRVGNIICIPTCN
jgi:hypothetical protein